MILRNGLTRMAHWVWSDDTIGARMTRIMLSPASWLFGVAVAQRNARFDRASGNGVRPAAADTTGGTKRVRQPVLPTLSVGNLTVGGTGKTPVAAWCARKLREAGGRPAVVLRGYGNDEWRVHMLLNPGIPVLVAPDRLNGIVVAKTRGANCVVLDDAFQHRQAARVADIVLLSADQWTSNTRLLPAGPFREPMAALRRASVVVVTVKSATPEQIERVEQAVRNAAPDTPLSLVRLALGPLQLAAALPVVAASGVAVPRPGDNTGLLERPVHWLDGRTIVVATGIGDPLALHTQLATAGATLKTATYADHHHFTAHDAEKIARTAVGTDGVVCTLKDAVKLAPLWPRAAPPLWYVSQSVVIERGAPALDRALARVLAAPMAMTSTAG